MTTAPAALQLGHLAFQLLTLAAERSNSDMTSELHRLRRSMLPIGVGNRECPDEVDLH